MEKEQEISQKLKALRLDRGLTQEKMANILGISRASYINVENGSRDLTLRELETLRQSLNLSAAELINQTASSKNAEKFRQILLYILKTHFPETGVPKTKLAKLLYLVDFTNFYENLTSMSGVSYLRRDYGPVADIFFETVDELYSEGKIDIKLLDYAQMIGPTEEDADFSDLSSEDKVIINKICQYWKRRRTPEIVNFTHSQKPWRECRDGEIIPYSLIIQEDPDHVFAPTKAK